MGISTGLILASALHGLVLSLVMAVRGYLRKQEENLWFSALLLCLSIYLLEHYGVEIGFYADHPSLVLLTYPILFFIGPFFFIYYSLVRGRQLGKWKLYVLIPPVLIYLLFLPFYIINARIDPIGGVCSLVTTQANFPYFNLLLDQLSFPVYTTLMLAVTPFIRFNTNPNQHFISARLKWINLLTYLLLAYFILFILSMAFKEQLQIISADGLSSLQFVGLAAIIHLITYVAILEPAIFSNVKPFSIGKYKHSSLDSHMSRIILGQIKNQVEVKQAYLDNSYSMQQLSSELSISRHRISQVINQELGLTFLEYINKCRVIKAKQALEKAEGRVIVNRLALDVGFNNKVSFYRAFKKHFGRSPSDFRKEFEKSVTSDRV